MITHLTYFRVSGWLQKPLILRNDLQKLIHGMGTLSVSIQCRNNILQHLISEDKLDEAAKVALAAIKHFSKAKKYHDAKETGKIKLARVLRFIKYLLN